MNFSVLKGASYVLVHAPDMVIHNGSTQTTERILHPDSEYLKELPNHLRSFEDAVSYYPNQVYIGNKSPEALKEIEKPWYDKKLEGASREGKFGEIMPQDEFIAMIKISDAFDLVLLTQEFTDSVRAKLENHKLITEEMISKLKEGFDAQEIEKFVNEDHSEGLYYDGKLVGCIKRAHDVDINLNSHVMMENLVSKASGVLAALSCIEKNNINPDEINYVIECSEEACGDVNQRGGGNFAKAIAEMAGLVNATGSDTRGFCAAPAHALILASSLVASGTFKNVMVVSGGSTAKLGMNGKDHIKKDMPILEDVIGGFACIISENDGVNPIIRNDIVGKHRVGTGAAPQAILTALVIDPLESNGLKITDIDKYSVEMQNPDVTKPAGAGDVPNANYKMIAALAVKQGELDKKQLNEFIDKHGMEGWAPTQGHIPSGVPYLGFAREDILSNKIKNTMIIGKGSLFLGRLTNLFDGASIVIEKNTGKTESEKGVSEEEVRSFVAEAMRDFATHLMES